MAFYEQFFKPKDLKKNTMLIKGITNAGKTKFIEKLQMIFPCEEFV